MGHMSPMTNKLQQKLAHLPAKPGAYIMKDEQGEVIYVGKAASLRSRVRSYFQKGQAHPPKVLALVAKIKDVDWIVTDSEVEALMLECNLIKKHRPYYNVRLRDDKHYPYLCVTTSEPFPRVLVVRRVKQDGNRYFGPYTDTTAMRETTRLIRKVFRIRSCNKKLTGLERDRPCLNLHLGQCDSPCSAKVSREEYAELVRGTCEFLEGKRESLALRLEQEMMAASESLEFERAAKLRDQVESIHKVVEKQKVIDTDATERDVIALHADGGSVCVQLLFVRTGRLIGQEHFSLEGTAEEEPSAVLNEFVKQFYRDATYIPKEVLLSHEIAEKPIFEEWLSQKRGSKVKLSKPKRGEKTRLVDMALENASLTAERERTQVMENEESAAEDLDALTEALGLPDIPSRIEAYDISNIQGAEAVGSMVVFENGVPAKSQYRRFKIRLGNQPDDYGMMKEVLRRRLAGASSENPKFLPLPDLILIDGGRGQLNAALEAVEAEMANGQWLMANEKSGHQPSTISHQPFVISLAKRLEEVYLPHKADPLLLPRDSHALKLLQRIRDEAHRFALSYHHKLREKSARKSILDSIPGVGDHRRKALIRKFGSVAGVRRASLEELMSVPGITNITAQTIYDTLHS